MGAQGQAVAQFVSFPGNAEAQITVTGQAGILGTSDVEAWIRCEASADHSADEHAIEDFYVQAQSIVAGTGFTITVRPRVGVCYDRYNVSWVWN